MEQQEPLKIFIGWDSREDIAYQVARFSLYNRASVPIDVQPIQQYEMRLRKLYWRERDKEGATEFTVTRFLTPLLAKYDGWALFTDADFLFRCDIKELFDQADDKYAVMVAKHDYVPPERIKMDHMVQHQYPRKNWSSCMLLNCGHPATKTLTPDYINSVQPSELHQLRWAKDEEIGEFDHTYNWLEGWYDMVDGEIPKIIHYTRGGPWFDDKFGWSQVDFSELWIEEMVAYENLTKGILY